jgi:hypothetical protein
MNAFLDHVATWESHAYTITISGDAAEEIGCCRMAMLNSDLA